MILVAAALAFALGTAFAGNEPKTSDVDSKRLDTIPARMQDWVKSGEFSGAVTLVLRDGQIIHSSAVGMQNVEEKLPMREDSIFQIMSMTKPVTAVAIMMLVEEGKISLYDEVQIYLPEFRNQKVSMGGWLRTPSRPIQIHDLLSHTSGMRQVPQGPMKDLYHTLDHSLAEAVAEFAKEPLEFEPGTKWLYSNPGIATLGRIIEVVSGQPYEKFIESRILLPLQMNDTFFFPPADKINRIAIVYTQKDGKLVRAPADSLGGDPGLFRKGAKYPAPEFGLFSTARDMSHFYQMILDNGTWNGVRLLSPAAIEAMTNIRTTGMQAGWHPGADYGLSWEIISKPLGTLSFLPIGTFGHGGAFGTQGWVIPKRNMVTVFMIGCAGQECSDTPNRAFQQIVASSLLH
jgi:CubicO group peptidase (beta-lactamase class C family)